MTTFWKQTTYPNTPSGPNTQGFPAYPRLDNYPQYKPMINPVGELDYYARLRASPINANLTSNNLLKSFDTNQSLAANQLQSQLDQNRSSALNPLLSKGVSTDALARVTQTMDNSANQQIGDFYSKAMAQRYSIEDQNAARNLETQRFNSQQQMNADQFNIGNILGERRFANNSSVNAAQMEQADNRAYMDYWMQKYMTDKQLEGAQASAKAMKKSRGDGVLGLGIGGIL